VVGWTWEPSVLLGTGALATGYTLAIGRWRARFVGSGPVGGGRIFAFWAGLATILLALASPLDLLSDRYLLSAHMVQHLLLTLIMPPLLLVGTPGWLLRPLLRSWLVERVARLWSRPLAAFLAFNAAIGFSHFPPIYNATLLDHRLHVAMHLLYMATAVAAWWPIFSPLPELPRLVPPLQMLYVFVMTIPSGLVGSFIALAPAVLYPFYAAAPRIVSLSPLEDQQLAGLIMWVGVSTLMLGLLTVVFFSWAHQEQAAELHSV
jgi:putative membrane protein